MSNGNNVTQFPKSPSTRHGPDGCTFCDLLLRGLHRQILLSPFSIGEYIAPATYSPFGTTPKVNRESQPTEVPTCEVFLFHTTFFPRAYVWVCVCFPCATKANIADNIGDPISTYSLLREPGKCSSRKSTGKHCCTSRTVPRLHGSQRLLGRKSQSARAEADVNIYEKIIAVEPASRWGRSVPSTSHCTTVPKLRVPVKRAATGSTAQCTASPLQVPYPGAGCFSCGLFYGDALPASCSVSVDRQSGGLCLAMRGTALRCALLCGYRVTAW